MAVDASISRTCPKCGNTVESYQSHEHVWVGNVMHCQHSKCPEEK